MPFLFYTKSYKRFGNCRMSLSFDVSVLWTYTGANRLQIHLLFCNVKICCQTTVLQTIRCIHYTLFSSFPLAHSSTKCKDLLAWLAASKSNKILSISGWSLPKQQAFEEHLTNFSVKFYLDFHFLKRKLNHPSKCIQISKFLVSETKLSKRKKTPKIFQVENYELRSYPNVNAKDIFKWESEFLLIIPDLAGLMRIIWIEFLWNWYSNRQGQWEENA